MRRCGRLQDKVLPLLLYHSAPDLFAYGSCAFKVQVSITDLSTQPLKPVHTHTHTHTHTCLNVLFPLLSLFLPWLPMSPHFCARIRATTSSVYALYVCVAAEVQGWYRACGGVQGAGAGQQVRYKLPTLNASVCVCVCVCDCVRVLDCVTMCACACTRFVASHTVQANCACVRACVCVCVCVYVQLHARGLLRWPLHGSLGRSPLHNHALRAHGRSAAQRTRGYVGHRAVRYAAHTVTRAHSHTCTHTQARAHADHLEPGKPIGSLIPCRECVCMCACVSQYLCV